jgi:hypothetical protein
MKRKIAIKLLLLAILLIAVTANPCYPQKFGKYSFKYGLQYFFYKNFLGVNFGSSLFYGDISNNDYKPFSKEFQDYKWAYGLTFSRSLHPVFDVQLQFIKGKCAGTDVYIVDSILRKDYFSSSLFEYGIALSINISHLVNPRVPDNRFNFYLLSGAGMLHYKSEKINFFSKSSLGSSKGNTFVLPVALGVRCVLSELISLNFEFSMRKTWTDNIDCTVRTGSSKDMYGYTSAGIIFRLATRK